MRLRLCRSAIRHPPTGYIYCNHAYRQPAFFFIITLHLHPTTAVTHSITTNMCSIFALALLFSLSSAIPLLSRQSKAASPFVVKPTQPGSPIHLSSLNANNGHFWFGKATSSSCPANIEPRCPTGTQTAFVVSSEGHATLVRSSIPLLPLSSSSP